MAYGNHRTYFTVKTMNEKEYAVYQALQRVHSFGISYGASFPATSQAVPGFERAGELVAAIGHVDFGRGFPTSSATQAKSDHVEDLWDALKSVSRTARAIAFQESGFDRKFLLGPYSHREILATAETFIEELQTPGTIAKFTAYDLSPNIVATLQSYLQNIQIHEGGQTDDHRSEVGETARVRGHIKEAREVIKKLDASVHNLFAGDEAVLAEWRSASRVHSTSTPAATPPANPAS